MSNIATFELSCLEGIPDALRKAEQEIGDGFWWRGQSDVEWHLVPGAHRDPYKGFERDLYAQFRRLARSRSDAFPQGDDPRDWLPLAQHHRLPTRLLDWSRSPLVALYFALSAEEPGQEQSPAALWALNPSGLNKNQIGVDKVALLREPSILPLFAPLEGAPVGSGVADKIVAVFANETHLRMMVQQGEMTLHGTDDGIDQLPGAQDFVVKFMIPTSHRQQLWAQLLALRAFLWVPTRGAPSRGTLLPPSA